MIFRVAGAALFLWAIVVIRGVSVPRCWGLWLVLTIMAVFNSALPFSLIGWGQILITSGLSSILISMTPLLALITAHFFPDDEAFTPIKGLGVLSGLIGAVVMIGPEFLRDIGTNVFAQLAVLGGAVSYSIAAVFGQRDLPWPCRAWRNPNPRTTHRDGVHRAGAGPDRRAFFRAPLDALRLLSPRRPRSPARRHSRYGFRRHRRAA